MSRILPKLMLLAAIGEYGTTEDTRPGKHNPRILGYAKYAGFKVIDDETAWCAIFMSYIAKVCGAQYSKRMDARSWLKIGESTDCPSPGDVVVFWRENVTSWKGHVGIFIKKVGGSIYTLGGNQGNQVKIAPYSAERFLDYRRLNYV